MKIAFIEKELTQQNYRRDLEVIRREIFHSFQRYLSFCLGVKTGLGIYVFIFFPVSRRISCTIRYRYCYFIMFSRTTKLNNTMGYNIEHIFNIDHYLTKMWRATLSKSVKEVRFVLKQSPEHHGVW